jgi:hypothetical protein
MCLERTFSGYLAYFFEVGLMQLEAEQRQRRVACVEGRLAARAGESQRVARQRLAAHSGPWRCSTRQSVRGFARCRNTIGLCCAASSASARLQNAHWGSCRSRPSSVCVVLLASKADWQLTRVKRLASLASASLHTLPRRARAPCRCRVCAATQGTSKTFVVKEAERSLGDGGGCGVIFFESANKLVLIMLTSVTCMSHL